MKPSWTATAAVATVAFALLPIAATASAAPLPAPVPATPTAGTTVDQPVFSWNPVDGAVSYEIEVALDDQFVTVTDPGDEREPRKVYGTAYVPTFTYSAKSHFWHVRAVTADGMPGAWSDAREFTRRWTSADEGPGTEQGDPSSRVNNVHLVDGVGGLPLNRIAVAWDPVHGASRYEVQFSEDASFETYVRCETTHTVVTPYAASSNSRRPSPPECQVDAEVGDTLYVRVRALDMPTWNDYPPTGDNPYALHGIWSDEFDELPPPNAQPPGPLSISLRPSDTGQGGIGAPAEPVEGQGIHPDVPMLQWQAVLGATGYKVVIATDRDFTNVVAAYATSQTVLQPPETFDDSNGSGAYHWMALPCTTPSPIVSCDTPTRSGVNTPRVWSFRKRSEPIGGLLAQSRNGQRNVQLSWEDALTSTTRQYSDETSGGVVLYELQYAPEGVWSKGTTVRTDNLSFATGLNSPPASGVYSWRVRAWDGDTVPLAWATGPDFTIVQPDDPDPDPSTSPSVSPSASQSTPNPGSSTPGGSQPSPSSSGPPPNYQAPAPDEGTATDLPPDTPGKPGVKRSGKKYLRLHWRASEELGSPVSRYLVYRSTNGNSFSVVRRTTSTTTRLKSSRKKTYWFYIVADSDAGRSEPSATTKFPK